MRPQIVRQQAEPLATAKVHSEIGRASWYDLKGKTASGEMMNPNDFTAAHRSLPLGIEVLVENMENGQTAHVRVNDRGPYAKGRLERSYGIALNSGADRDDWQSERSFVATATAIRPCGEIVTTNKAFLIRMRPNFPPPS